MYVKSSPPQQDVVKEATGFSVLRQAFYHWHCLILSFIFCVYFFLMYYDSDTLNSFAICQRLSALLRACQRLSPSSQPADLEIQSNIKVKIQFIFCIASMSWQLQVCMKLVYGIIVFTGTKTRQFFSRMFVIEKRLKNCLPLRDT